MGEKAVKLEWSPATHTIAASIILINIIVIWKTDGQLLVYAICRRGQISERGVHFVGSFLLSFRVGDMVLIPFSSACITIQLYCRKLLLTLSLNTKIYLQRNNYSSKEPLFTVTTWRGGGQVKGWEQTLHFFYFIKFCWFFVFLYFFKLPDNAWINFDYKIFWEYV